MAFFPFWPFSRDTSLYELSPFDASAYLPCSPPQLHYDWMNAICHREFLDPRPAAPMPSKLLFCTMLLIPIFALPYLGPIPLETDAYLTCAKLSKAFYNSPLLYRMLLGSFSKAVFILIWRLHSTGHGSLRVSFFHRDHLSYLCSYGAFQAKHCVSAFWLSSRCLHRLFHFPSRAFCRQLSYLLQRTVTSPTPPQVFWPLAAGVCGFLVFTWPWGLPCLLGFPSSLERDRSCFLPMALGHFLCSRRPRPRG